MNRRWLRLALILVVGGLCGLAYWGWREGQVERQREATRELSIKEPSRRSVDPQTKEVVVRLDAETQKRLGLVVEPCQRVEWQQTIKLLGFTVVAPHRLAEVRSPWTGVMEAPSESGMPSVGQKVSKGQLVGNLLVQWNPSDRIQLETQLRDARGTIAETEAQLAVARSTVERLQKIGEQVVASKLLIEAQGNLAQLEARLNAARAREADLQDALVKQSTEFRFRLTAPQAGRLTELSARPGEVVSAGSVVATIYDPQDLWVTVSAPPGVLPLSDIPDEAEIRLPGFQSRPLPAKLARVKTEALRQQQGVELDYAATNPDGLIPVGLQAEATLHVGPEKEVVRAPQTAVLQLNDRYLLYVERAAGEFVKQLVEIDGEDDSFVYLRPTPAIDGQVVVSGAQTLLSEEYKESIQLVEESAQPASSEPEKPQEK